MCVNTCFFKENNIDHQTDGKVIFCAIHSSDDKKRTFKQNTYIYTSNMSRRVMFFLNK
jgi:hypothetical protein